jgi:hypothetical protein
MTAEGVVIPLRSPRTTASETNPFPLWNDPEFYSDSKADSRAFGTGHLKKECARGQILWIDEAGLCRPSKCVGRSISQAATLAG